MRVGVDVVTLPGAGRAIRMPFGWDAKTDGQLGVSGIMGLARNSPFLASVGGRLKLILQKDPVAAEPVEFRVIPQATSWTASVVLESSSLVSSITVLFDTGAAAAIALRKDLLDLLFGALDFDMHSGLYRQSPLLPTLFVSQGESRLTITPEMYTKSQYLLLAVIPETAPIDMIIGAPLLHSISLDCHIPSLTVTPISAPR